MKTSPFEAASLPQDLVPAPIEPSWIRTGKPVARNKVISHSVDGSAFTMVWDCTAGSFEWTYDCDETVYLLEGSVVLTDEGNAPRRLGPGDTVFFPKGAKVHWTVDSYVRKLAFMRQTVPAPVSFLMKVMRRLKREVARLGARRIVSAGRPLGQRTAALSR